jgi:hypothetical protein
MRAVLDTNVLVSAAFKQISMPGMAALVVERRGGLLKSQETSSRHCEERSDEAISIG